MIHFRRRSLSFLIAILIALPGALPVRAGGGSEMVAVVINADSPVSMRVANEFIHLRKIPANNVIYLRNLPSFESVSVDTFREKILKPVLGILQKRRLAGQIGCIAWSTDIPYAVDFKDDPAARHVQPRTPPVGSITGLTYLYSFVLQKHEAYAKLDVNYYMQRPQPRLRDLKPWTSDEQKQMLQVVRILEGEKDGKKNRKRKPSPQDLGQAAQILDGLNKAHPGSAEVLYNFARVFAWMNRAEQALGALDAAVQCGWWSELRIKNEVAFDGFKKNDKFEEILEKIEKPIFQVAGPRPFYGHVGWHPVGQAVNPDKGPRYMLSTMLSWTAARGLSAGEAVAQLRRSAGADGTRPEGTFYYMVNKDIRSQTRAWAYPAAKTALEGLGFQAEIDRGTIPRHKKDILGAMIGTAKFDWDRSKNTIVPGAIVEHLTSQGAIFRPDLADQTPLTALLRAGAAGASGTVEEPLSIQAKFPMAFLHVHYATGASLAEAFYQSVRGPYQLLVVGDPLCRPFARIPTVKVEFDDGQALEPGAVVSGQLSIRPSVADPIKTPVKGFWLYINGLRGAGCKLGETLELDTAKVPDGVHEVHIVALGSDSAETQGMLALPLTVKNGQAVPAAEPPAETNVTWGTPVSIKASLPGAMGMLLLHNGRPIAKAAGAEGTLSFDPQVLGFGPARVKVAGVIKNGDKQMAMPGPAFDLNVRVAAPLPPAVDLAGKHLRHGVRVTPAGGKTETVTRLGKTGHGKNRRDETLLEAAKVEAGKGFMLETILDMPRDDHYQIQVRTPGVVQVAIDGAQVPSPGGTTWKYFAMPLEKGKHRLVVTVETTDKSFDLRLGCLGTKRIEPKDFEVVKE